MLEIRHISTSIQMKTSLGVTALDLLITMALVAILAVAGLPGLREYGMNQRIKSAVTLLHADLSMARSEAIKLNTWTIACPGQTDSGCASHSQWNQGWLVFADLNGDRDWQSTEPLLRQAIASEGLTALGPLSRKQVRFFPGGSAPGSNTSIVVCDRRGYRKGQKIVISNSGRIRRAALTSNDETRCPPG